MNRLQQELLNSVVTMYREIYEGLVHDQELSEISDRMTKRNNLLYRLFDQASDQDKLELFQVLDACRNKEQAIIDEYRVRQQELRNKMSGIKKIKNYLE